MKKKSIIFFGKSGSGKGTQAQLLIEKMKECDPSRRVVYIETGKLLRAFAEAPGYSNKKVADILDKGGLLEEFMPINLWSNKMITENTGEEHFVFDGVARRPDEAPILDSALDFYNIEERHTVLIEVSNEWAVDKLLKRGREDDNEEEIRNRLAWYDEYVKDSLRYYQNNSEYNFHKINGEQSVEEVHRDILTALGI